MRSLRPLPKILTWPFPAESEKSPTLRQINSLLLGTTVVLFTLICAQVAMKVLVGAGEEKPAAQVSEAEPVADIDAALKRGCAAVAQQNALTQREEEVLFLLAHGRSARYIADELVI